MTKIHDLSSNGVNSIGWVAEVNTFADLPAVADNTGNTYLVLTSTGLLITFNLKRAGFYYSDGITWEKKGEVQQMFRDDQLTFQDNLDNTKQIGFQLSSIGTGVRRIFTWPNKNGIVAMLSDITGGSTTITLAKPQGDAISSAGSSFLSSSGRTFFSHSGTGPSTDECAFSFQPKKWVSGAKVWVDIASGNDGVKFMVYQAKISVNNGGVQVSETVTFTKVLTDDTSLFEKLSTEKLEFSSTITDVITPDSNITVKVIRDAGHVDDDYTGLSYTEFLNFEFNY